MTELEKAEKLRSIADVSFAEAKEALDASDGDILAALIYLEDHGKSTVPAGGGQYSSAGGNGEGHRAGSDGGSAASNGESFGSMMRRFGKFCMMLLKKGNSNFLEAGKNGRLMFSCPVTIVVAFLLFFFWITVPLFIISLFFGWRYRFRGADLGRDSVNHVMDSASELVDDVKKSFNNRDGNSSDGNCDASE
ncbi:MAG: ubiquitin [Oscillospiraceae bacterium]|nr:ubiquitin [Oscillospiraceae bacterium]